MSQRRNVDQPRWLRQCVRALRGETADEAVRNAIAHGFDPLEIQIAGRWTIDKLLGIDADARAKDAMQRAIAAVGRATGRLAVHGMLRRARLARSFGSHTKAEWQAVLARHGHRCAECGTRLKIAKDHIVPICAGGSNLALNLQPLCTSCNSSKGGRIRPGTQIGIFDRILGAPTRA